jgi:hypothetical protein
MSARYLPQASAEIHRYVVFTVAFPSDNELSAEAIQGLKQFLPGPPDGDDAAVYDEDAEIVHLEPADATAFGKGGLQNHDTANESDEEDGNPQAVNCQQS